MKKAGQGVPGASANVGNRWTAGAWSMTWSEVLADVPVLENSGSTVHITGIAYDSRRVRPGDLFVAMRGGSTDGNRFIHAAVANGAAGIVTDSREAYDAVRTMNTSLPAVLVQRGRRALAAIAAHLFGHPERVLAVSAITGTNGKTTTAFLLEQILKHAGRTCVLLGTIETHIADEVRPSEHTTPEASDVLSLFADGVLAGATEAVMEMSSHALDQERVWGIPVAVAIYTNLTQDHLDYHQTMDHYFAAKARLFEGVGTRAPLVAVINLDDARGPALAQRAAEAGSRVMTYGINQAGDYRAKEVHVQAGRTSFEFVTPSGTISIRSGLTGRVNVYNLLAALCAGLARGLSLEQVASAAKVLGVVPGRFEVVPSGDTGITVVVDYAHTDDALRNLIALGRELVSGHAGRVITLFGCGGDRDRGKRPKMGKIAAEESDLVVVTSDNPRSEDPLAIIAEIMAAMHETTVTCIIEEDRAAAIRRAILAARSGDIVLIAGKGHEKTQTFATGPIPFDDVAEAAKAVRDLHQGAALALENQ